ASAANKATATSATTTVMGRESAARTARMGPPAWTADKCRGSLICLRQKRRQISCDRGEAEQSAPHTEPSQGIVHLGLSQQALRVGNFGDVSQSRFVS